MTQTVLLLLLMLALAMTPTSRGADITTRDGITYHNAEVTGIDPDGIRVTHSTGVTKLRFEELPEALQKHYHFDAAKVVAYRKQVEDARKAAAAQAAAVKEQRSREALRAQQETQRRTEEQCRLERERIEAQKRAEFLAAVGRVVGIGISIFVAVFFYFIPSIVGRHKTNAGAILVLNLFLGWTFLGWVLALVWACTKDPAMDMLAKERMESREASRYIE